MDLLPLGSVIKINNHKAFIIGYSSDDRGEVSRYGYFIVSYPIGFTSVDKVVFIPHDSVFTVLSEGYKTKGSEQLLKVLSESLIKVQSASVDDVLQLNQHLKDLSFKEREGMQ